MPFATVNAFLDEPSNGDEVFLPPADPAKWVKKLLKEVKAEGHLRIALANTGDDQIVLALGARVDVHKLEDCESLVLALNRESCRELITALETVLHSTASKPKSR